MGVAAILGAGDLGGAIAHRLAARARFREIRLIDANGAVAAGKALDIRQSGPVEGFETRVTAASDPLDAAGASVVIVADQAAGGEWGGEPGLELVRRLWRAGSRAPFVFAGATQLWLMEAAVRELGVPADRVAGTAPASLEGAARALVGMEVDGSGADARVVVAGRPPSLVVVWSSATVGGGLVTDRVPPHRLLALAQAVRRLWPPRPYAVAAATARAAEGLTFGARQAVSALTVLDGEFGARRVAAMLPLRLGGGRVIERLVPSLSPQERVELVNGLVAPAS